MLLCDHSVKKQKTPPEITQDVLWREDSISSETVFYYYYYHFN